MSFVSSYVILTSIAEEDEGTLEAINAFFAGRNPGFDDGCGFAQISQHLTSGKALQACVFAGAFNYLDDAAFLAHLRSVPWQEREHVRVFINGEHDAGWSELPIRRDG